MMPVGLCEEMASNRQESLAITPAGVPATGRRGRSTPTMPATAIGTGGAKHLNNLFLARRSRHFSCRFTQLASFDDSFAAFVT